MSFTRNNISYNFGALPKFDPFRLDKTILHKNMVSFVYTSIVASNIHFNISGCSENFCFWLCYKPQITILMIWVFFNHNSMHGCVKERCTWVMWEFTRAL